MDKSVLLDHLELAKGHVQTGERLLDEQRTLVAKLRRDGHSPTDAERHLAEFEQIQALHLADVERLINELAKESDR